MQTAGRRRDPLAKEVNQMLGQQRSFSDKEQEQMSSMDIDSFTIVLFRWLKANLEPSHSWETSNWFFVEDIGRRFFPESNIDDYIADENRIKLSEAIANLERKRVVVRMHDREMLRPVICVSSIGLKSDVDDDVLLLVDKPEYIVSALEQKIGGLDDVIRQYYLESLRAYQEELYISSVICLGAASERAIHWLADALGEHFPEYQAEIQRKQKSGNVGRLIQYLSDSVIPNIFDDDKRLRTDVQERLTGLGNVYRENRNEAGHPKAVKKSWLNEHQEVLLVHFAGYITAISEAVVKSKPTAPA